uniref:Coilin_N domain-containing protein n=1 Tax=Glossina brevipalpis TaxID=37001 RepID=A0A1A9X3E2_9MUSC
MQRYAIKIDFSLFFNDERKYIFIIVEPEWKFVEDLQIRIQNLYDVDAVRFLNSDNCFLHPQEPIEIIKFCQALKAFAPKESLERRKGKSKKEKRHQDEAMQATSCEHSSKEARKKRKLEENASSGSALIESKSENDRKDDDNAIMVNKKQKASKSNEISSTSETVSGTIDGDNNRKANKKKLKNHLQSFEQFHVKQAEKDTDSPRFSRVATSTPFAENKIIDSNTKFAGSAEAKHIHFLDADESVSTTAISAKGGKPSKKSAFRCPLNEVHDDITKPRIFPMPWSSEGKAKSAQLIEIKENIVLPSNYLIKETIDSLQKKIEKSNNQIPENAKIDTIETTLETIVNEKDQASVERENNKTIPNESVDDNTEIISNEKKEKIEIKTALETCSPDHKIKDHADEKIAKIKKTGSRSDLLDGSVDCIDLSADLDEEMGATSLIDSIKINGNESAESDIEEVSEIIDLNEPNDVNISKQSLLLPPPDFNGINIARILPFCIRIYELPKKNDIIVFKVYVSAI